MSEFIGALFDVGLGFGACYLYFVQFKGYAPPKKRRKLSVPRTPDGQC